jgi:hypothetical protein
MKYYLEELGGAPNSASCRNPASLPQVRETLAGPLQVSPKIRETLAGTTASLPQVRETLAETLQVSHRFVGTLAEVFNCLCFILIIHSKIPNRNKTGTKKGLEKTSFLPNWLKPSASVIANVVKQSRIFDKSTNAVTTSLRRRKQSLTGCRNHIIATQEAILPASRNPNISWRSD